jgi:Ca2+-transporting ATPase
MVLILLIPPIMNIFGTVAMDGIHWAYVLLLSLVPIVMVEWMKLMKLNGSKDEY